MTWQKCTICKSTLRITGRSCFACRGTAYERGIASGPYRARARTR